MAGDSWYRKPRALLILSLIVVAAIAAAFFIVGRDSSKARQSGPSTQTITEYFRANDITATPASRGESGTPTIVFPLAPGWSDGGEDTPAGAYGSAFYDASVDPDRPASINVLLSKLSGDADPAKILEYAPNELQKLPGYKEGSKPSTSTLSGFDAVQLAGLYTLNGAERVIAQKTVVIPGNDGLFVLQMNADAPKGDAAELQKATALLDEQAKITP